MRGTDVPGIAIGFAAEGVHVSGRTDEGGLTTRSSVPRRDVTDEDIGE